MTEIEAISKGWEQHIHNQKPPRQPIDEQDHRSHVYAGSRRKCLRRMVEEAIHPSYFPDFDVDAKARFIRGEQREVDMRQSLERVGQLCMPSFTVEGQQQRISVKDRKGRVVIRGKIDCKIRWESGAKWPTEFKSWAPWLTDKIFTFQDLWNSPYTWSGAHQLLSYLFSENAPYGLLVLDRPGLPRLIKVSLEEAFALYGMEEFLRDATICVDHIEAGTLPGYIDDPAECKRCPLFGKHCNPPTKFAGAAIVTDEETIHLTERYSELLQMPEIEEFEKLDKWAKDTFRGTTVPTVVGKCVVGGHWQKNTVYELTDDAKKAIEVIKKPFAKKVEQGKYFLDVTRVEQ